MLVIVSDQNEAVLATVRIDNWVWRIGEHHVAQTLNGMAGIFQKVPDSILYVVVGEEGYRAWIRQPHGSAVQLLRPLR